MTANNDDVLVCNGLIDAAKSRQFLLDLSTAHGGLNRIIYSTVMGN